jgi:hypothetical protein
MGGFPIYGIIELFKFLFYFIDFLESEKEKKVNTNQWGLTKRSVPMIECESAMVGNKCMVH